MYLKKRWCTNGKKFFKSCYLKKITNEKLVPKILPKDSASSSFLANVVKS